MSTYVPDDYVPPSPDDFAGWTHWSPPGYPIHDEFHNPWVPVDPISGKCAFNVWDDMGRPTDDVELRQKLADLKAANTSWDQAQQTESFATGSGFAARHAGGSYIARLVAHGLVDGAKGSLSSHEVPVLQSTGNGGYHEVRDSEAVQAVSGEDDASTGDRSASLFVALVQTYSRGVTVTDQRYTPKTSTRWTKVETAVGAKCKDCDKMIAEGDAQTMNRVFETARDHAEQNGHTVVIRQVERIEVSA